MSHSRVSPVFPVPVFADPTDNYSVPVTRNGVSYVYNNSTSEWESQISKNVDVVTKVTDQSYEHENNDTVTVSHKANEELLTIPEIDTNFISLKQGIVGLEKELKYWIHHLEDEIGTVSGNAATTTSVNTSLSGKMNITGGEFSGPIFAANTNVTTVPQGSGLGTNDKYYVYSSWVQNELQNLNVNLVPKAGATQNLGNNSNPWNNLYLDGTILPTGLAAGGTYTFGEAPNQQTATYYNVSLGSQNQAFEELYVKDAFFSGNTITIGEASLSATSSGGVLLPSNSSIGTEENEIPTNFGNTVIEERFSRSSQATETLQTNFQVSGSVSFGDPVKLLVDGTVAAVNSINGNDNFVGFAAASASAPNSAIVTIHGPVTGFSNLTSGDLVYLTATGSVTQTRSSTTIKIGVATSTSAIFLFSTSAIDTYTLNKLKIDRTDLSVINTTPSGTGTLSYNNSTGVFAMTFPDLTTFATQSYVNSQISDLIDGAPGTLNTLNELAAAINDNDNFASSITQSLALKSPIASPSFTGTPRAPTPATTSNDTTVATTAFVKQQAGSQTLGGLTDVSITSPQQDQVIAYDTSTQSFRNVNQSGVGGAGGTVNFVVDGGTASTVSSDVIIFLDGGSA